MLKELVKKRRRYFRIGLWEHWREKTENPVARIHLCPDLVLVEMFMKLRQVFFDQISYDKSMFMEAWEPHLVDIPKLVLLDQLNEQPES